MKAGHLPLPPSFSSSLPVSDAHIFIHIRHESSAPVMRLFGKKADYTEEEEKHFPEILPNTPKK
jgi:hypothetical protein